MNDGTTRSLLQVLKDIARNMGANQVLEKQNDGDPVLDIFFPRLTEHHAAPDVVAQRSEYEAANLAWLTTHLIGAIGLCIDRSGARNDTVAGYIADVAPAFRGHRIEVFVAGFDEIVFPVVGDEYRQFLATITPRQHTPPCSQHT